MSAALSRRQLLTFWRRADGAPSRAPSPDAAAAAVPAGPAAGDAFSLDRFYAARPAPAPTAAEALPRFVVRTATALPGVARVAIAHPLDPGADDDV
ncbi:MAG: hypothetical protein H6709_13625 [Kofleriaceae bacterium]|nr:hypothetical protein [Kofleriaceae bacterium]MCB9573118.1 hypothetical protein [Kofleriaceae bacterium]